MPQMQSILDGIEFAGSGGGGPLSLNQEGRLLLEGTHTARLVPFHVVRCFALDGRYDAAAIERALNDIIQRHESLRTGFNRLSDSAPNAPGLTQMVGAPRFAPFIRPDASLSLVTHAPSDSEYLGAYSAALRRVATEFNRPFDLDRPPLMRASVVRVNAQKHLLVVVVHHLLADDWSMQIFERELRAAYESFAAGLEPSLPLPAMRYGDFATWQRQQLESGCLAASLAYWKEQWRTYGDAQLSVRDLPFGRVTGQMTLVAREDHVSFDRPSWTDIQQFARDRKVTVYALLLAAFVRALHLATHKDRIAIWGQFANRLRFETENVIGWFANAQLLGFACEQMDSPESLLAQARKVAVGANNHQVIPPAFLWAFLERLPERPSHFLTDAWVSFDLKADRRVDEAEPPTLEPVHVPVPKVVRGIQMLAVRRRNSLSITATYSQETFDRSGVRALLTSMQDSVDLLVGRGWSTNSSSGRDPAVRITTG